MTRAIAIFLITINLLSGFMTVPVMNMPHAKAQECCADQSSGSKSCNNHPLKKEKDSCKKECRECRTCLTVCGILPANHQHKRNFALTTVPYGTLVQNKVSGFSFDVWKPPRV